ncbi:MAG: ABC transporter ATP-binding protein [Halobacteriaceae archaeon]
MSRATLVDRQVENAGTDETVLAVDGLTKVYGDGETAVRAVDDVSFSVERGEVVGVLGPNGAGKTTTIKSILGLVIPTAGSVEIAGVDAHEHPRRVYHHVGAMLEGARNIYWRLTVRENLQYFAALAGQRGAEARDRQDRLLDQFGLREKADTHVNDLSRGQKQKVSLAATLARGTEVVFLDEPTLGLDVEASLELRRELRRLAEEEDITVVLSSHDMDVVEEVCDRVVILSDGQVIADDAVEDLVRVFETQAYRVAVEGRVPQAVRDRLGRRFDATNFDEVGDRTRFEVTLADGDALYDVLDVVRSADLPLVDVDGLDPDLETVFLEVTGRTPGEPP